MFTLILPALLREPHETLPELHTPALNQLLRYARVQPTAYSRMQLYQTYLCDQLGQPENTKYRFQAALTASRYSSQPFFLLVCPMPTLKLLVGSSWR